MSEFERYILDVDRVASSLPMPNDFEIEIIADLKNESNLEEIALTEAAILARTHPNLYSICEKVALYHRLARPGMNAEKSSRIGFALGSMVAYDAAGVSSSTYYLHDADSDVVDNFYGTDWLSLHLLLTATEQATEEVLEPLHQAMDYHLEFDGDQRIHHKAARLGASVCYSILNYQWDKLDGELEDLYREHSTISPEIASLRSRQILAGLSAALQHYPRPKKSNLSQTS